LTEVSSAVVILLTFFRTEAICSQTKHIKPSAKIRTYDAEDFFQLLNYHEKKVTLDYVVEILTQSALEAAGEHEYQLSEGLGLIAAGIRVLEDTDWNGERAETTGLGIMLVLDCYGMILNEKKRYLSHQTQWLVFLK
jgi:hypothetical protein